MIFDGKAFARQRELKLKQKLQGLKDRPKILSLLIGNDPPSLLYSRLKQKAAQRVGIDFQLLHLRKTNFSSPQEIIAKINFLANQFTALMVQLPLPPKLKPFTSQILKAIPLDKDIDGLRWQESQIMPATVKAILSVLENIQIKFQSDLWQKKFTVIGSQGTVGKPLVHFLKQKGIFPDEIDLETPNPFEITRRNEVLISCTGQPHLIKPFWVKPKTIVIDVGISKVKGKIAGDFDPQVYQSASIAVPVPGGIGPVTIVSLLENSLELLTS